MVKVEVKMNFDMKKFKLDLSPEINRAADVVVTDIQRHIASGLRIDTEGRQAALAEATVHAKRAKGGLPAQHQTDILIETENLWRNQKVKRATPKQRQYAEITIGPTREEIGVWLQEGTKKMPARPFFAISKRAEEGIVKMVELTIERELAKI